jgi:hypothetical protein
MRSKFKAPHDGGAYCTVAAQLTSLQHGGEAAAAADVEGGQRHLRAGLPHLPH